MGLAVPQDGLGTQMYNGNVDSAVLAVRNRIGHSEWKDGAQRQEG